MEYENGTWIMHGVAGDDPTCLHSVQDAINYIKEVGFLPLFKNGIPGFSLEERTEPQFWWCGDSALDPWEWRALIARSGAIAVYAKPEAIWGYEYVTSRYHEEPVDSGKAIAQHMMELYPTVEATAIKKLLGGSVATSVKTKKKREVRSG